MTASRSSTARSRRFAVALLVVLALPVGGCARRVSRDAARDRTPPPPGPASATPAPAPAHAVDAGYDLRPAEQAAVDDFLRQHPEVRVATDADHRRSEDDDTDGLYGVYHPYFIRGDDNDDGILDFVLGFVRRDSDRDTPWFSVVVFEGKPDGGFEPGGFLEREISLADGDLSLDRDAIVVTPDVSEDLTRRYRWDPTKRRHVFVRDDASDDSTSPPASQI
jgi:hypothetical protein